jgi:hypothetical protein
MTQSPSSPPAPALEPAATGANAPTGRTRHVGDADAAVGGLGRRPGDSSSVAVSRLAVSGSVVARRDAADGGDSGRRVRAVPVGRLLNRAGRGRHHRLEGTVGGFGVNGWRRAPRPRSGLNRGAAVRVARLGVAGAVSVALAACSPGTTATTSSGASSGTDRAGSEATSPPSVAGPLLPRLTAPLTPAQAAAVSDDYDEGNNAANARRDPRVLARVETESALGIDVAAYRIFAAQHAPVGSNGPLASFTTTARRFVIPRLLPGQTPWWLMIGRVKPGTSSAEETLHLFVRDHGAWKVARLAHGPAGWLPALAAGNGGPVEVDGAELSRAVASPARIGQAVAAAVAGPSVTAGRRPAVAVAGSAALGLMRADFRVGPGVLSRAAAGVAQPVYGLRTANGGTLMLLRLQMVRALSVADGSIVVKDAPDAAFVGDRERPRLAEVFDYDLATYTAPRGPTRLLAFYGGLTDAH